MIDERIPMDRRHDDSYERFLEQRLQTLNNTEGVGMEDSLPFPIVLLGTVPTALPQKQNSKTSCDSGVNSPHVLSPAMPVTPNNSQP